MSNAVSNWDNLTAVAVLGTERAESGENLFQAPGELGKVLAAAKAGEPEIAVLNAASILHRYLRAGSRLPKSTTALPAPANRDAAPVCSRSAEILLARILRGECIDTLSEALELLTKANQRMPERLIPTLLEHATEKRDTRLLARQTIGERGRWLAAQNADWSWVLATSTDVDSIWQTGTLDQRVEALKSVRVEDPTKGRQLLESTWAQESPENRTTFIAVLRQGLSQTDEEFLETALDDKRKEVRRITADLLAHLPTSRLCQRMRQRTTPLLIFIAGKKSKLLKALGQRSSIEVTLPESCDKAVLRDGIEPKPPHSKMGEKAWWLQQMLSAVPPSVWSNGWAATPGEVIEAAIKSDWRDALLDGWSQAAARHADQPWIVALFEHWISPMSYVDGLGRSDLIKEMLQALAPEAADTLLIKILAAGKLQLNESAVLRMLWVTEFNWSIELSERVIQSMHRTFSNWSGGHEAEVTRAAQECFGLRMSPRLASEAEKSWPTESPPWFPLNTKQMNAFLEMLKLRQDLHKEIKP